MTKGKIITYKGVTYEVRQNKNRSIDLCGECDLCKDFIESFGEKGVEGVCNIDCIDYSLYLKRKEERQ